jgi:hypothetical protein
VIPSRNPFYRAALARPHEAYTRVEVWRSNIKVDELVWRDNTQRYTRATPVFFGGNIRATLSSRVTRTLSMTVPDFLYPWGTHDLLNPYGNELRAFRGIRYGNDNRDEFPTFVGPIMNVRPPRNGECSVEASDVTVRVAGAGFVAPLPSQAGDLVLDEFERLVLDVNPLAVFGPHSPITDLVPVLGYDSDRGDALDNLAKTANAFWYALADGRYVMRRVPWSVKPSAMPIPMVDGPDGTLLSAFPDRGSSGIFNQVTVVSDRPDGGSPLWATATDNDPDSPTWVGGPFGIRSARPVRVTGADNQGQLLALAKALIARSRTLVDSWQITCVPDASIELGDPLGLSYRSQPALQVVAALTMPLEPTGSMSVDGRGLDLTATEESA